MTNVGNMPAQLGINVERRFPESVEAAAHYVVAEALTNAAKPIPVDRDSSARAAKYVDRQWGNASNR